jgi:hypothetical protein
MVKICNECQTTQSPQFIKFLNLELLCRKCYKKRKYALAEPDAATIERRRLAGEAAQKRYREANREAVNRKAALRMEELRRSHPDLIKERKKQHYEKHREKIAAQGKIYRGKNAERIKAARKASYNLKSDEWRKKEKERLKNWHEKNPRTLERAESNKKWYIENRKTVLEKQREYERKNPEKIRIKRKRLYPKYYAKHKGKLIYRANLKRLQIRQATPKWSDRKKILEIYENCPEGYNVDHIVPLIHPFVCGLHVPNNLQYLAENENKRKGNRFDGTVDNKNWESAKRYRAK